MKIQNINSLVATFIGGLYFKTYFPIILIFIVVLQNRIPKELLFVVTIYFILFGYLFNPGLMNLSSLGPFIIMILIPHLCILKDLFEINVQKNSLKINIFILILILVGYIYFECFLLGIGLLFFIKFQKLINKTIIVFLFPIIITFIIFLKYYEIIHKNYIYEIILITGLGIILYSTYMCYNTKNIKS